MNLSNNFKLSIIILLLATIQFKVCGQNGAWMKTIKDSGSTYYFSNPFFVEEDSLYIHILSNTGYDPYYICGPYNGAIYYLKIAKLNGSVMSSRRIMNGATMNGTSAKYIKGSLYISSTVNIPWVLQYGMIFKFNTNTFTIPWSKFILINQPTNIQINESAINKFQTTNLNDKLYFFANKTFTVPFLGLVPSFARGGIDTMGTLFNGNQGVPPTFTVFNAPYTTYKNVDFIHLLPSNRTNFIGQNHLSNNVALFSSTSQSMSGTYFGTQLNIKSNGNNYVEKVGHKIIYVVSDSTGTNCIITDFLNNILISKKIPNLYCRSIAKNVNSTIITLINSINGIHGDYIYNIQLDSNLNTISARKMFLDTFRINKFNSKTIMDSSHFTNVFNFPINLSKDIFINRQRFNTLACNELSFSPQIISTNISTINAVISLTGSSTTSLTLISTFPTSFKDSIYCFIGERPNSISNILTNSVCVGGVSTLSVSITNTPATFVWNFQNASINTSSLTNPSLIFNSSGIHIATISTNNFYGNSNTTVNIRVWPNPTISISGASICLGQSCNIQPSGASSYTFLGVFPVINPTLTTTYSVIGTSSNGCLSSSIAVAQVIVWPQPSITIIPSKSLVCIGENYSLVASGCNTYTWNTGLQGNISNQIAQPNIGYSVVCTDLNGCYSSSFYKIRTSYCTFDLRENQKIEVNLIEVELKKELISIYNNSHSNIYIELCDSFGKLILKKELSDDIGKIDLSSFSKSVYYIRIYNNELFYSKKLSYCNY